MWRCLLSRANLQSFCLFDCSAARAGGFGGELINTLLRWILCVWRVTCDVWRVTCDVWRVTCDVWRWSMPQFKCPLYKTSGSDVRLSHKISRHLLVRSIASTIFSTRPRTRCSFCIVFSTSSLIANSSSCFLIAECVTAMRTVIFSTSKPTVAAAREIRARNSWFETRRAFYENWFLRR